MATLEKPQLITPEETGQLLNKSKATLAVWRATKRYPLAYIKIGRSVMYDLRDVLNFLERRRIRRVEPR